ncbi:CRAL/TRIO domain-containing protein [Xylariomycetidae sp. FL0641]|nr:CRAL/TRIO domain-containing protein [Xylariomycetidae sp. FL0641]
MADATAPTEASAAAAPAPATAPEATPAAATTPAAPKPDEPTTPLQELWTLARGHAHKEVWGVTLADPGTHVPSQIVLQKYLNANEGDVVKAGEQLKATLDWRAKTDPLGLVHRAYAKEKFGALGYVTTYVKDGVDEAKLKDDPESREVFTWNVYGNVKSVEETFGELEQFIHWRVALMEMAVQALSLPTATKPITADHDPYKIFQVHDYKSVSFLRQSPQIKAASTETIKVFATAYPELLKEKFFINVPAIMGFMYAFMKLFVAAKTVKKFHPMSNGGALAKEFASSSQIPNLGEKLPAAYGGKGPELQAQGKEPNVK